MSRLISPKEAAEQLGIRPSTLLRQIRSGVCRHRRLGHLIFLTQSDIDDMVTNAAVAGGTDTGGTDNGRVDARQEDGAGL